MSTVFQIRGTIRGTPRTYGARHSEDAWRRCVVEGAWSGYEDLAFPLSSDLELEFSFRIHAGSPDYGWRPHPNGCDLDTLVVQSSTCAALLCGRNEKRPSLRWIANPKCVRRLWATKTIVTDGSQAGVDIVIRPLGSSLVPASAAPALAFDVPDTYRGRLIEGAKISAAAANSRAITFGSSLPIGFLLEFDDQLRRVNVLGERVLEWLIDGTGASVVGTRRLFDETPGSTPGARHDTDDSMVFDLFVDTTRRLAAGVFAHCEIRRLLKR